MTTWSTPVMDWTALFRIGPISSPAETPNLIWNNTSTCSVSILHGESSAVRHPWARQMSTEQLWDTSFHPLRLYLADREKHRLYEEKHQLLYRLCSVLRNESAPWTRRDWYSCTPGWLLLCVCFLTGNHWAAGHQKPPSCIKGAWCVTVLLGQLVLHPEGRKCFHLPPWHGLHCLRPQLIYEHGGDELTVGPEVFSNLSGSKILMPQDPKHLGEGIDTVAPLATKIMLPPTSIKDKILPAGMWLSGHFAPEMHMHWEGREVRTCRF